VNNDDNDEENSRLRGQGNNGGMRFIKILATSDDNNGGPGSEILLIEPTYPNPYYKGSIDNNRRDSYQSPNKKNG
jgi:hypothetical protein